MTLLQMLSFVGSLVWLICSASGLPCTVFRFQHTIASELSWLSFSPSASDLLSRRVPGSDLWMILLQALTPQMTENKKRVEELLREALILQAALESETEAGLLERLLPKRYKQYQKGISSRA